MSTTIVTLLDGPLGSSLTLRLLPAEPRVITQLTLLEDMSLTEALLPGAMAVMSRNTRGQTGGYELDVLVRRAAEREVAALVLRRSARRSATAESLAQRGRVALIDVSDDEDPLQVFSRLSEAVSGDARASLARLALMADYHPERDLDVEATLSELSSVSGVKLLISDTTEIGPVVEVDGGRRGVVTSSDIGSAATVASAIAAATLSRTLTAREREVMQPLRSTSSVLSQLLLCAQAHLAAVSERALEAGLQVHGWHCATRLAVASRDAEAEALLPDLEKDVVALVARRTTDPSEAWTVARPDSTLVLVRTTRSDPGRGSYDSVRRAVDEVLADLTTRYPALSFRVGQATAHEGAAGLRLSAEESNVALASAHLSDEPISIATFDSLGLTRMLAEWLVTDTARETVGELLSALDTLGPEKAAIAIETLHVYLDERGSLQRSAERLNLHRNAVVYRMNQISQVLPNDLKDPDQRFALQLACRARLMSTGRL